MASNNNYYGGFTHGGTQYGQAGQYQHQPPANQQGYATQPQQQYAMQAQQQQQQQQQAYAPPPYTEITGYTRPVGAPPQQQPQPQDYYNQQTIQGQQQQAYAGSITPVHPKPPGTGTIQPRPSANSTVYPTYSANTAGTTNTTSYAGFTHPTSAVGKVGSGGFNYDTAVYNAVSAYAAQGSGGPKGAGIGYKRGGGGGGGGGGNRMKGQRPMPKPQTLHYCDVCKISCAGPQTYKEHLEGQKHKKKEAAMKVIVAQPTVTKGPFGNGPLAIKCELCDVICTGNDAYAAHLRGSKHQKVVKLHTKLGKPIPTEVTTVPTSITTPVPAGPKLPTNGQQQQNNNSPFVKPAPPPKISFLGPKTDFDRYAGGKQEDSTPVTSSPTTGFTTASTTSAPPPPTLSGGNIAPVGGNATNIEMVDKDIQPVGYEYIEEQRSDDGKLVSFNCKLCECRFNDPNAKEMHMKGRRHRLQYKKKVQPDLVVDVKPSSRSKKMDERRSRQTSMRGQPRNGPPGPGGPVGPPPLLPPGRGFGPVPPGYNSHFFNSPPMRRAETIDDRHVMTKHQEIYPLEDELQAIQKIVSNTEKALKLVSDVFADEYLATLDIKTENGSEESKQDIDAQQHRILKGVMRVGYLAKGLLLRGDRLVQLVVLCSQKPSITMLNRVFSLLPEHFKTLVTDDTYELEKKVEEAAIYIKATNEPQIKIKLVLTSPLLRGPNPEATAGEVEATQVVEPTDPLNKEECLDALAALRHAKFFQARATSLQSCVIVIRILRDICNRVPAWNVFPAWGLELLAEKTINSAGMPVSPSEALRLIFETISHGILLPGGAGIHDPCEKEAVDALGNMSVQSREDITAYAQFALRKIIFRKINEVLDIESLYKKGNLSRKRRRNSSAGGEKDDLEKDGKKDKKDDLMDTTDIKVEGAGK